MLQAGPSQFQAKKLWKNSYMLGSNQVSDQLLISDLYVLLHLVIKFTVRDTGIASRLSNMLPALDLVS